MVTHEGAIYVTSNRGYSWRAAVQESLSATRNRRVSSSISGAGYDTGIFNIVKRSPDGRCSAVSSRMNFYLTWEPGQFDGKWRNYGETICEHRRGYNEKDLDK
ncbi:hypothetical protein QJS10_CPB15g00051 [Acorus calamus]|uniref:Photosynthesis system II assembly factor Ycf48/Hcf136-like domain-containing protein n=1 Tax=Acorus calamus TaxID=4465 RepID=A0AAV9D7C3_ACOCL|nr:hypothetical protein QJS10_CPB15g00051 [Acorus calamus]